MYRRGHPALITTPAHRHQRAPPARAKFVIKGKASMARCNKMAYSGLWSLFTALYLIPTTRGYGWDMDVLFMIMYGATLMQIQNKGKLSFCAFKRPIIFFSPSKTDAEQIKWCKKKKKRSKKTGVSDVRRTSLLCVLVCLRLWALQLRASLAELLTRNHSFILSPRGSQKSFTALRVKVEPGPNPHHQRKRQRNKSSQ